MKGKTVPEITFHSVILNPDSVSRVIPPTMTIQNTIPATKKRYFDTRGVVRRGGSEVVDEDEEEVVEGEERGCEAVEEGVMDAVERSRIRWRRR